MKLKCKECGSNNTVILTREQLSNAMNKPESNLGTAGFVDLTLVIQMFSALVSLASKALDYFKEKKKSEIKYVFCKDCGYYAKL